MSRTLVFALIAAIGLLGIAAALRLRDAPYLAYADGNRVAALDGLQRKAEAGDGFAAFLVGNAYRDGLRGPRDPRAAETWYMSATRSGEIRAVSAYLNLVTAQAPGPATCEIVVTLLDLAARSGDLGSIFTLGRYYEAGTCVDRDLSRAAGYYAAAEQIDRRLWERKDLVLAQLKSDGGTPPRARAKQTNIPIEEALARFLVEAPALPTATSHEDH